MLERGEIELGPGERHRRGQERHLGAAPPGPRAYRLQGRVRLAVGEAHLVDLAVPPDAELQLLRQRVHHRHADAVQAARDLVGVLVEFSAGVELGHDDLGGRNPLPLVDARRDAAAVILDRAGAVRVEDHRHLVIVAGKRLVDGVVDDLVDHVMEAGPVIGIADIHARTLAHCVEALQDLDRLLVIGFAGQNRLDFVHEFSLLGGSGQRSRREDQSGGEPARKQGPRTP